ncbi:MAG: hypothetical protein VXZ09_08985 [Pseudomonadota bacterium]|nr:hypothetical protein [Pseudomonadota bacterium]
MELRVKVRGAAGMVSGGKEGFVIGAATFGAGTMSGGEGDGFIIEKQFGVAVGGHEVALTVFE